MSKSVQTALETAVPTEEQDDDCDCDELPGEWPCAACYINGEQELPVDAEGL